MIKSNFLFAALVLLVCIGGACGHKDNQMAVLSWSEEKGKICIRLLEETMFITPMKENAVRVQIQQNSGGKLPELVYVDTCFNVNYSLKETQNGIHVRTPKMEVVVDKKSGKLLFLDEDGESVLTEAKRNLSLSSIQGVETYLSEQGFESPDDEYLFGLGQFQDGYLNVRGLTRRLTQVNTQISIPFLLSNKGYGILWNNYGLTDFNPSTDSVKLDKTEFSGERTIVDVTSTEGTVQETRLVKKYVSSLNIPEAGKYSILLDVGQKMAKRHHLQIDSVDVIKVVNHWLPPTASVIVDLEAGEHDLLAYLEENDNPIVYYKKVDNQTVFRSPVSDGIDYTVFVGNANQVILSYRELTGHAPMLPKWALGYLHCRERFHSQDELLETAKRFRKEQIPIDLIIQDWQYWGRYGWNAMKFDEEYYPDPKHMVDELHKMDMHLMLSVWSCVEKQSHVGKALEESGCYIPSTSWVDFFNPKAAEIYWEHFSKGLLNPYGIDAWWQDGTEPENDDLSGRMVMSGKIPGEMFRNVYPLLVNKTVYNGNRQDNKTKRVMILTRSGFAGMQRYGAATWSGDVGHDWDALRRQIVGGLGQMASGLPWWTYDAGGFFRPGEKQYTDTAYHECFLRWLQTAVFLPLLRVHGYQSNTEFWNYGPKVMEVAKKALNLRYRMLPYIYSEAANITFKGGTMMRPFIMDFPDDKDALEQKYEFMFGPNLLVSPVVESGKKKQNVYLPDDKIKWVDFWTGKILDGGNFIETDITLDYIPLFVKSGSILPLGPVMQYVDEQKNPPLEIRIYPGADGEYVLYEDEGDNYNYENGDYATIHMKWNEKKQELTIGERKGRFPGMSSIRKIRIVKVSPSSGIGIDTTNTVNKELEYMGKEVKVKL